VLAARALAARPELAEAAHVVEAADALAYRERARRMPWFEYFQVERSVRSTVDWAVSLGITIPILSLNGGEIEAADARSHGAITARRRLATATLQELDAAIALAETTGKRSREIAARVEPLDQAMTQLVAQSAGVADPVKLLLLEERHVRAERKVLEAAFEHRLALIALEALTGGSTWH
jgi:outer membrane protein TolC